MSSKKPNTAPKQPKAETKPETEKPANGEQATPRGAMFIPVPVAVEKQYEFSHGEEVLIRVLGKIGIVLGIYIGANDTAKFEVEFADKDGNIQSRYFAEAELRSVEQ